MFKAIFCDEKNEHLLKWLIEKCLGKKVKIINIIKPEIIKPNIYVKNKTLDVLLEVDSEIINLEINSGYYDGLHERNASYIFSKYSEGIKVGEVYDKMTKYYQINFTRGLSTKYPLLGIYTLTENDNNINFIDNLTIFEYNIDKIHDACYNKNDMTYDYVAILDSSEEELEKICKGERHMEDYKENIKRLNENKRFTDWISEEEDARKVTNTLIHNAKEEGKEENKIEIAKKLLKNNIDIDIIVDSTGLAKEEIEKL
ncbi:MAG: PD-(D/E)XK nuclease family transposase [Bacilli bacterium]|nr:PD-(D/E)XK nuclease family transposase [Bacilli bacterium]